LRALVFTHPASVADYQAFIQAVEFSSTSDNPTNFGANPTRTLRWGLSDGNTYSAAQGSTEIVITAVDDPAVAQNDAVATSENSAITTGNVLADNGSGADSDPDNLLFFVTAVAGGTVGKQFALPSGALLTVNANGTFSYDPNHVFDYLPAPGSGASDLTYVDRFSYTITGGETATVTVTVSGLDTNDVLYDSAGIDTLAGGIGDDLYYVTNTGDVVIEAASAGNDIVGASVDYALPENHNIETLSMLGSGLIGTGSSGADTLHSSGGPNRLVGLGGDDHYYVNNSADEVIEAPNGGYDTVISTVDYALPEDHNIELFSMFGSGLTGTGSSGADTLHSSGGPNILVGLGGDDLYYANNAADEVIEAANGGYDTVVATVDFTLPDNVEALYVIGSGLTGTGNSEANTLISIGANTLVGGLGNDTFELFAGSADGATVADFDRSEGDVLVFSGFGTEAQGATFIQVGTTDQWQIHSGLDPTHIETITFSNHATLHTGDWVFV
jgi:Ca2+-binding RTX toxin-like protein